MDPSKFDAFTKAIATATSRREALRRIGGILAGVSLAGIVPGVALAGGGNSACAHFCNSVFGPGPDRGKCKSDAAHGTGLCYTCGPASPGGTQSICCPQNSDGTCSSYSSATCCGSGQTCQNGTCVTPPPVCSNPYTDSCVLFGTPNCGPSNSCSCVQSIEGSVSCLGSFQPFPCASDNDCASFGSGSLCIPAGSCFGSVCGFTVCSG